MRSCWRCGFFVHAARRFQLRSCRIVRDVRMVEDRSFEGVQPRLCGSAVHIPRDTGRVTTGRSPFSRKETSGRNYSPPLDRAPRKTPRGFPRCPARLSIRAPRNFYYRARGAREGPPIYSNRRFRKFCLLLEIKDSLIGIPPSFAVYY